MMRTWKEAPAWWLAAGLLLGGVVAATAISLSGPFGPEGEGGSINGQTFTIGPGGAVFELDAFVHLSGMDLNGSQPGGAAQLSRDALPAGFDSSFAAFFSPDQSDLLLEYTLTNLSAAPLPFARFLVMLDPDIDRDVNGFANENGSVLGTLGSGAADPDPDGFEIDEPGLVFGDLFLNAQAGDLDETNALPVGSEDDVALALEFAVGVIGPGDVVVVNVQVSEDGDVSGGFALVHADADPASSATQITLSGQTSATLTADSDSDGRLDGVDNCVLEPNGPTGGIADQLDTDADGYGNACDCDFDQDGFCTIGDFNLFLPDFQSSSDSGVGTDMDGDGFVAIGDFNLFLPGFVSGRPGPSALLP